MAAAVGRGEARILGKGPHAHPPAPPCAPTGGPSGACAAETLAAGGVETFLIERKLDNCKVRT